MPGSKNIVFDVVGTLASYDSFHQAIDEVIGDRLRAKGIGIEAFASFRIDVCGREYSNLSQSGNYTPTSRIFEALFYRILYQCGISEPRHFATDEDRAAVIAGYRELRLRPGAIECIQKLRNAGFTVWGLTSGNRETVHGYIINSGVEMPKEHLMACDDIQIAKPDLQCYRPSLKMLSGEGKARPWFAAAHQWDSHGAQCAGYRGAYCMEHESEAFDVLGKVEVVAPTLPEMADKIIAATAESP